MLAHVSQVIPVQPRLAFFCAGLDPEQIGIAANHHILEISGRAVDLAEHLLCFDRFHTAAAIGYAVLRGRQRYLRACVVKVFVFLPCRRYRRILRKVKLPLPEGLVPLRVQDGLLHHGLLYNKQCIGGILLPVGLDRKGHLGARKQLTQPLILEFQHRFVAVGCGEFLHHSPVLGRLCVNGIAQLQLAIRIAVQLDGEGMIRRVLLRAVIGV